MRSTNPKEREAGRKAEVQRRREKNSQAKQAANPHVDASAKPDDLSVDSIIENDVNNEAEMHNPFGLYRTSFDRSSPAYQGAITGLSDSEAEDKMGFFANLGDAIGVTNARNDYTKPMWKRMADRVLWNLDSRNPSGGLEGVAENPAIVTMGMAGVSPAQLIKFGIGSTLFNNITTPFTGRTIGQHAGDWFPIVTGTTGDVAATMAGGGWGTKVYGKYLEPGIQSRLQGIRDFRTMLNN